MFSIGNRVKTKTPAGLWLRDRPHDGTYDQQHKAIGPIKKGVVLEVKDVVTDYDSWPDSKDHGLGKVKSQEVLVQSGNIKGWAGDGALVRMS